VIAGLVVLVYCVCGGSSGAQPGGAQPGGAQPGGAQPGGAEQPTLIQPLQATTNAPQEVFVDGTFYISRAVMPLDAIEGLESPPDSPISPISPGDNDEIDLDFFDIMELHDEELLINILTSSTVSVFLRVLLLIFISRLIV